MCRDCYYQLRQLRIISSSLTSTATATLVHAFVSARLEYCSTLYAGLPGVHLGCLEWVICTVARLIGGIPRTGHGSAYMLDLLQWLPLQHRIVLRSSALAWRCLLCLAPAYLRDLCYPTLSTRGCSSLQSMEWGGTLCPCCLYFDSSGSCILGGRPSVWNWLPLASAAIAPQGSL